MGKEQNEKKKQKKKGWLLPFAQIAASVVPSLISGLLGILGKGSVEVEVEEEKMQNGKSKRYHNCRYRNRNGTNKLREKGDICMFGGTN